MICSSLFSCSPKSTYQSLIVTVSLCGGFQIELVGFITPVRITVQSFTQNAFTAPSGDFGFHTCLYFIIAKHSLTDWLTRKMVSSIQETGHLHVISHVNLPQQKQVQTWQMFHLLTLMNNAVYNKNTITSQPPGWGYFIHTSTWKTGQRRSFWPKTATLVNVLDTNLRLTDILSFLLVT